MSIFIPELAVSKPVHLGSGTWALRGLTDIVVIFGRNGSGKSQLLRLIRDSDKPNCHYSSPERGGEINYDPGQVFQELDSNQRASKRTVNFQPSYRSEVISRVGSFLQKRGGIQAERIPMNPNEIEMLLGDLLPNFRIEISRTENVPFKIVRLPREEQVSSINALSSGESEVLTLGLDLLTICAIWELEDKPKRVLLIDEPDTHLHPELQQHLARFITKIVERFHTQVLVATHSTTLLSALGSHGEEKTSIIYLDNSREEQVAIPFDEQLRTIAACLGGHALMGPLFSSPLLLVEGDDDYRIWSEAARLHKIKLAVIPCSGSDIDNYRKTLEKLFRALLDNPSGPSGFVLKDRDETGPITHDQTALHVRTLKLKCREGENMYLTDEVLSSMETNWENVQTEINRLASSFGAKEQRLRALTGQDRKEVDLKGLMEQLSKIIDVKNVDWRIRVGRLIGQQKPVGQIAEFLGQDVIDALWG